ncbi:hypothetical protein [Rhodovulum sulfidophilum]|uniref:hypothetical protein n=1 Tax=Rhodovulum sulfidophilum TaxID=35806 RepID=UPI000A5620B0|nr:hypothetical protein [Rhodovulum sulfidophilum]MBL3553934.1 hypothetical protein [Rhodovulum sulfidophilum]
MSPTDLILRNVAVYLPLALIAFYLTWRRKSRNKRERESALKSGNTRQHRGDEHMFCDYAEWQSGISGPQPLRKVAPRIAPILQSATQDRVFLQAGYHVILRRAIITFALMVIMGGMALPAIRDVGSYISYDNSLIYFVENAQGDTDRISIKTEPSFFGYFHKKWNDVSLFFDPDSVRSPGEFFGSVRAYISFMFAELAFYGSFLAFLVMLLFKAPAPIVVDRKRRLVYTWHRGRIWAARWDDVAITRVEGHLRHTALAFALHDTKGKGGTRWFILSGAPAWGEKDDPRDRLLSDARDFNRWQGMRLWLHEWVEGRREPSQADLSRRFAVMHLLVPLQRKIPEAAIRQLDGI